MRKIQIARRISVRSVGLAFNLMNTVEHSVQMDTAELKRLLNGLTQEIG